MKQLGIKQINGIIRVKTGLHIGAGSDKVEIGGIDNPIIKNPLTHEPYIPGSSIKGKMRSLMEWKGGKVVNAKGKPCDCGQALCKICRVFGTGNTKNADPNRGPTRIIVRDAVLSKKSKEDFNSGKPILEEKSENTINRITATATPRFLERVVPDTTFDFSISYKVIDTGDGGKTDNEYFNSVVLTALSILEKDYLGGGGSRGNGRIEFENLVDEDGNKITLPEI